jgi:hypothetical protein
MAGAIARRARGEHHLCTCRCPGLRLPTALVPELLEALTHYMRSDEHRVSHDRISLRLGAAIKLERLDRLHTDDVVAT